MEIWELVDKNKVKTGVKWERENPVHLPDGMYHIVVDVWVKNSRGEILLTQRDATKTDGLLWESTGGSVVAGETSLDGAVRELCEETGIVVPADSLVHLGDTFYKYWIVESFVCCVENDVKITLQKGETVDYRWVKSSDIPLWKDKMPVSVWERYNRFCLYINNINKTG